VTHSLPRLALPLILFLLALTGGGCRREAARPVPGHTTPLKIIYTADTAGALDPCG